MEELEAEARRRSVGRVIADICRDLGVAPGLCAGGFWNDFFHALISYSGNLAGFCGEMRRREVVFEKELDKRPALGWPEQGREAVRRVLGFFIGEELVDPYAGMAMAGVPGAAAARAGRPDDRAWTGGEADARGRHSAGPAVLILAEGEDFCAVPVGGCPISDP